MVSLSIIAIIIVTFLSAIYSMATGRPFKQLWRWLGILAAVIIIVSFLGLLAILRGDYFYNYYAIPQAGWVLAFIGAMAIGLGGWKVKSRG